MIAIRKIGSRLRPHTWWYHIPEPRVVSILTGIAYLTFMATGIVTIMFPPKSIEGLAGSVTMQLVGWFCIGGAVIGIIGESSDFWQLERVGIATLAAGLATYAAIISTLHVIEGGRLTQLGIISIAMMLLALRLAMIWRYPFKPRGGHDSN